MLYLRDWPPRKEFCAEIFPTVLVASPSSIDVSSSVMYQLPRFWVKESAPKNMSDMPVTPETSHSEMSPLKEAALANILDMPVTPETSHGEMSPLKEAAPANIPDMPVTP